MRKLSRYTAVFLIVLIFAASFVSCSKDTPEGDVGYIETEDDKNAAANDDGEKIPENKDSQLSDNVQDKPSGQVSGSSGGNSGADGSAAGYIEDENGRVLVTQTELSVDRDYRIQDPVTGGENAFIPETEQGLEKSERRATEASKYNFDQNPLINRDKQQNKTALPSFNIDDTGFVRAGTKLTDLRSKTLSFYTADNFAAWSYRNEKGQTVDEWEWFKLLKSELGLNIKYTVKQHTESTTAALTAMNAGAPCDIIYSNHVVFPSTLCISRSITDLININNLGSSPGVCKKTMDICKWGNTLRLVSPIGCVDVLWYNQTLAQQMGLSDPHVMWESGVWNWNTFRKFLLSVPASAKDGERLCAFVEWPHNASYIWPSTNGCVYIKIDAENSVPAIANAWDSPKTVEAWEFITGVHNSVNFGTGDGEEGLETAHLGLYEGTTLMSATMYTQVYRDTEYSKNIQLNWVPYPRSTNESGEEICQFYGFGMMLPQKTVNEYNVNIALKFMELWATRFTESLFDNLHTFEYYSFNYKQRKQYFDFVTRNVVFGLAMNDFDGSDVETQTHFFEAFLGNSDYNVKTEAAKASNLVQTYVEECMKYGR